MHICAKHNLSNTSQAKSSPKSTQTLVIPHPYAVICFHKTQKIFIYFFFYKESYIMPQQTRKYNYKSTIRSPHNLV